MNKYVYDAAQDATLAVQQETKSDNDVQAVIDAGKPLSVAKLFIELNARITGLEELEAEWWEYQQKAQAGDSEAAAYRDFLESGERTVSAGVDENGNELTRTETCTPRPWCAGYRGDESAPSAPVDTVAILARAKNFMRQALSVEKARQLSAGFEYDGNVYDSDANAVANITGAVAMLNAGAELPAGFAWTTAGNIDVPMDSAQLVALGQALNAHVLTVHVNSRAAKLQAAAAANLEELLDVSF